MSTIPKSVLPTDTSTDRRPVFRLQGWIHVVVRLHDDQISNLYVVRIHSQDLLYQLLDRYSHYLIDFFEAWGYPFENPMNFPEWLMDHCGIEAIEIDMITWEHGEEMYD